MSQKLKEIRTVEELNEVLRESNQRPVLLFKHSLTCAISTRALRELESYLDQADQRVACNLIVVQNARPVSDEVAARLRVRHESPQAMLIRNGRELWSASHFAITESALREAISQLHNR